MRHPRLLSACLTVALAYAAFGVGAQFVSGQSVATETVFVPITPCRLIDTRPGDLNTGPRSGKVGENETAQFTAWGTGDADSPCDIPSTAMAVATNTVAIAPTARSFMTLFPGDVDNPGTANLNYVAGQAPTPNAANIPLAPDGTFNVFNAFGEVHLVIDVNGYFHPSSAVGSPGPVGPPGAEGPTGPEGPAGEADPAVREHGRAIVASHPVVQTDDVGRHPSMAINAFGNPIISYLDRTNGELALALCANSTCTLASTRALDDADDRQTSIAIGDDGNPVIGYRRSASIHLAVCDDPTCTAWTIRVLPAAGFHGPAVTIGVDGNPIVAYGRDTDGRLAVTSCDDPTCATFTTATPDPDGRAGEGVAIAIGVDGNPVIAYGDTNASDRLAFAACADPACASATISRPDPKVDVGYNPSIAIGVDGNPVAVNYDNADGDIRFVACSDPSCSTASAVSIDPVPTPNVGAYPAITIGLDGHPVISYEDNADDEMRLATCGDPTCSTVEIATLGPSGNISVGSSIAISARGEPLVAYSDGRDDDLMMATRSMTAWTQNAWSS